MILKEKKERILFCALAAGLTGRIVEDSIDCHFIINTTNTLWQPHRSYSDCIFLAAKLGMEIKFCDYCVIVSCQDKFMRINYESEVEDISQFRIDAMVAAIIEVASRVGGMQLR